MLWIRLPIQGLLIAWVYWTCLQGLPIELPRIYPAAD
jgi:hypothetical protein